MADQAARPSVQLSQRSRWSFFILKLIGAILTAPYRRTFKVYTWRPLKEFRAADGNREEMIALARDFKMDKYAELQSVQVAASFCAGATLATLPWSRDQNASWVADALWLSSLSCSIWAVITSIQTKSILDDLPSEDLMSSSLPESEIQRMRRTILRYRKTPGISHWLMLFIWQFPSMTMSYAWTTFLAGLTVYICNPFIRHAAWGLHSKIAIVYLAVGSIGLLTYIVSSIFVYVGEKDFDRSVASTRINTNELETSTSPTCTNRSRRQQGLSGAETDPLQRARARGLFGVETTGESRRESDRSHRARRQLLI